MKRTDAFLLRHQWKIVGASVFLGLFVLLPNASLVRLFGGSFLLDVALVAVALGQDR